MVGGPSVCCHLNRNTGLVDLNRGEASAEGLRESVATLHVLARLLLRIFVNLLGLA